MPLIDILIFAAIALFLVFRLRSILGSRDGFEQKREEPSRFNNEPANDTDSEEEKVISLHGDKQAINGKGLTFVRQSDSSFRDDEFCFDQIVLHLQADAPSCSPSPLG